MVCVDYNAYHLPIHYSGLLNHAFDETWFKMAKLQHISIEIYMSHPTRKEGKYMKGKRCKTNQSSPLGSNAHTLLRYLEKEFQEIEVSIYILE